jgi:hypothetical protein
MGQASTVWMVHAHTGMDGIKGQLAMDGSRLVFRPESTVVGETVFDPRGLRRVRRARWSPVLEIYPTSEAFPPVVAFYFIRPPSLVERQESLNFLQRRSARRRAMNALRRANADKKDELARWVETIRSAGGG